MGAGSGQLGGRDGRCLVRRYAGGTGSGDVRPPNEYGVLDHEVVTPSGETVYVPLRAIPDGDRCEVVFTLRRSTGMTDAEFERDTALVNGDLTLLKKVLEGTDA